VKNVRQTRLSFIGQTFPLKVLVSYLTFGFVLFLLAPFDWVLTNTTMLVSYFSAVILVFVVGFQVRLKTRTFFALPLNYKQLIIWGTIVAILLLIPTTQLYSGKYPWQFMELLADQTGAYNTYQNRLLNSSSVDRAPIAIFRTLLYPIIFSVLPLIILNWKRLSNLNRICLPLIVSSLLITSLARGTDRETSDLVIFIFTCGLISYFREKNNDRSDLIDRQMIFGKIRLTFVVSVLAISVMVFFYFFVERKLGRYGGDITKVCVGSDQDICITNSALNMAWLGDWGIFAVGITAGYMSAGYYGLSLALDLDFQSTFGTGFSPLISRFYEGITGDSSMYMNSYTYRMRSLGWSDEYTWSTLMVWFANDVGFFGALNILFFLSMLFGASWRDAVLAKDDRAAIVFVMLFEMFVYLPANNQIGQSLDLSFAFLFWLFRWQYMKSRAPQFLNRQLRR
jgi:hypothetical protein